LLLKRVKQARTAAKAKFLKVEKSCCAHLASTEPDTVDPCLCINRALIKPAQIPQNMPIRRMS
jgi:hypothetical protein